MIKELGTMALVATMTTSITNNFEAVKGAALDISSIYGNAAMYSNDPDKFIKSVSQEQKRLTIFGNKVAKMDIEEAVRQEVGPFGVMVATN